MSSSSSRRRHRDDDDDVLEDGEFVPGSGYHTTASDDTDDDDSYWIQPRPRQNEDDARLPRLEQILAMGPDATLPSPTPAHEDNRVDSDVTVSDDGLGGSLSAAANAGGVDEGPIMRPVYSCHVCGKPFGSAKAVDGHMRVHDPHSRQHHVNVGGCSGGRKDKGKAPVSEEPNQSIGTTVSESIAFTRSNLSQSLSSMASARSHLVEYGEGSSSSRPNTIRNDPFINHPQQADQPVLRLTPPPVRGPDSPREQYTCKECGKSYRTNQALGGHVAGHKNKQRLAAAAAAAAGVGGVIIGAPRQGTAEHVCKKCGKVFQEGVQLGGHMRKHYDGPPIVFNRKSKKLCVAPPQVASSAVCMADLTPQPRDGQSPQPPPVAGRRLLRLFGVDIWVSEEAPAVVQQGTEIRTPAASEVQQSTDIRAPAAPEVQQGTDIRAPAAPEVQQGTEDTTVHGEDEDPEEGSSSATMEVEQRQNVEKSSTGSPSMESQN